MAASPSRSGALFLQEFPAWARPGILFQVLRIRFRHGQGKQEAHQLVLLIPADEEPAALSPEPEFHPPGGFLAFVRGGHRPEKGQVLLARGVGLESAGGFPFEHRTDDRILPVKIDQLDQKRSLDRSGRLFELAGVVRAGAAMQLGIEIGISPPQLRGQDLAHEIVREEPVAGRFHEGKSAQPFEQLIGVRPVQERGEKRFRGDADESGGLEPQPVFRAGQGLHQTLQEAADQSGVLFRAGEIRTRLRDRIGHEGKGERMPVGEFDDRLPLRFGHRTAGEVLEALLRAEVPEREGVKEALPSGIGPPGVLRRLPARHHHHGAFGKTRKELLPQPGVHAVEVLAVSSRSTCGPARSCKVRRGLRSATSRMLWSSPRNSSGDGSKLRASR